MARQPVGQRSAGEAQAPKVAFSFSGQVPMFTNQELLRDAEGRWKDPHMRDRVALVQ